MTSDRQPPLMLVLLASLTALGPLSTSMYLPSLPAITESLRTDVGTAQLTLSVYLAGWAGTMLLVGPFSDRLGRRPVLISGVICYCIASFACIFARSIELLILARFFQSVGSAAATVVARAIVRDIYEGPAAARMLSFMGVIMALVPALAPIFGGHLHVHFGWQSSFVFMACIGTALLLSVHLLLPETLRHLSREPVRAAAIVRDYAALLSHKRYVGFLLCASFGVAGSYAFVSTSSFALQEAYGVTEDRFGYYFGIVVFGFMLGALLGGRLSSRFGVDTLVRWGSLTVAASGTAMLLLAWSGIGGVVAVIAPQTIYYFGIGIVSPQSTAGVLTPFPMAAGSASSLFSFSVVIFGAISGAVAGYTFDGSPLPMVTIIGLMGWLSFLSCVALIQGQDTTIVTDGSKEREETP